MISGVVPSLMAWNKSDQAIAACFLELPILFNPDGLIQALFYRELKWIVDKPNPVFITLSVAVS